MFSLAQDMPPTHETGGKRENKESLQENDKMKINPDWQEFMVMVTLSATPAACC